MRSHRTGVVLTSRRRAARRYSSGLEGPCHVRTAQNISIDDIRRAVRVCLVRATGGVHTVKAFIAASPGVQKTRGPHGLSLLSHARAGGPGASAALKYLETLGDADPKYVNEALTEADRSAIIGTYAFGLAPPNA